MKKMCVCLLAMLATAFAVYARDNNTGSNTAFNSQGPLAFTRNIGQVHDQYRNPRNDIQFSVAATGGLNIFIGNGELHYQFSKAEKLPFQPLKGNRKHRQEIDAPQQYSMYRMDVTLIGANKNAEIVTEGEQAYHQNYFADWTGGKELTAHSFSKVTYKNVYPNIDWVFRISNGQLKHEFVVRPGGNAGDIKLKYGGATALSLNADGSLTAATPQGTITEQAPETYDLQGKTVSSKFLLNGNLLSYSLGACNTTFIIDPTLVWGTYYGGALSDNSSAVQTDPAGNVFIAGSTFSATDIATAGAYQTSLASNIDGFLAKFGSSGILLWATYYGGGNTDECHSVTTDLEGNVFISGYTYSNAGIATAGAYQTTHGGNTDAFLAKFDGSGAIKWATYFGGNGSESNYSLATDDSGDVLLSGYTSSSTGIATAGAYQPAIGGGNDGFLAKFDSTGSLSWATYFGGTSGEQIYGVCTGPSEDIYISGYTYSTSGIATAGAWQIAPGGGEDGFLAKFDSSGVLQWSTYYGGSADDYGNSISADTSGHIYLAGTTYSSSGIATAGAWQDTLGGDFDAFLARFDSSGALQWATYYGGANEEEGYAATGPLGNAYITGYTSSTSGITTPGSYQPVYGGGTYDLFLAQFDTAGILQWGSYYGGSSDDNYYNTPAADAYGNVYVTGYTYSTSGIATAGAWQDTITGDADALLAKFSFCETPVAAPISGLDSVCIGDTITLTDTVAGGTWSSQAGNTTVTAGMVTGVTAGIDTILYIVSAPCGADTAKKAVVVYDCTAGVKNITQQLIRIAPNPANNIVNINAPMPIEHVVVSDMTGREVLTQSGNKNNLKLNIQTLATGIYIIRINGAYVYKIVKE